MLLSGDNERTARAVLPNGKEILAYARRRDQPPRIEVGQERVRLQPGDSLLAPRQVPHVWAHVGEGRGRILIAFMPAGQMEAFFREVTKANAMPPQDPALWRAHGMELLGPPLAV